jgi:transposase-like protein
MSDRRGILLLNRLEVPMLPDFPKTAIEFNEVFSSEEACVAYVESVRWPEGFVCPKCGGRRAWRMKARPLMHCASCGRQTSITAGTPFHGTRKPLRAWFHAMFLVATSKTGTSAKNLQRQIGLGSYETAWTWLQKIRSGMRLPGRQKLKGTVEVDEGFIGGDEPGVRGRGAKTKALVVVAVEDEGGDRRTGRVRLEVIPTPSQEVLNTFVKENVASGSVVRTDGLNGYAKVADVGVRHESTTLKRSRKTASQLFPRVHLILALLKRWLLGTFQGRVSVKHLQSYLDEFCFRFNRRACRFVTGIFERVAGAVVASAPRPYRAIVGHPACPRAA